MWRWGPRLVVVMVLQLCTCAGGGWTTTVASLWAVQDRLVFQVPTTRRAHLDDRARAWGITVHDVVAEDGTRLYAWHADRGSDRLLLYFHGNGGGMQAAGWLAEKLDGFDVASFSYRGYPGSDGAPSEAGLVLDARAAWRWAIEDLGFAPDRIVLHGNSLGGGVSAALAADVHPAGVVWDSTFHSLLEIARDTVPGVPTASLLRHPFHTDRRAPRITAPVLLLHGTADTLIPLWHARANARLLPDAELVEIPGLGHGHWTLADPVADRAWRTFLERVVPPTAPAPAPGRPPTPPPTPDRGA